MKVRRVSQLWEAKGCRRPPSTVAQQSGRSLNVSSSCDSSGKKKTRRLEGRRLSRVVRPKRLVRSLIRPLSAPDQPKSKLQRVIKKKRQSAIKSPTSSFQLVPTDRILKAGATRLGDSSWTRSWWRPGSESHTPLTSSALELVDSGAD